MTCFRNSSTVSSSSNRQKCDYTRKGKLSANLYRICIVGVSMKRIYVTVKQQKRGRGSNSTLKVSRINAVLYWK